MLKLIASSICIASSLAFAGSNEGSVRCHQGNDLFADYVWFGGTADNFAQVYVYRRGQDGHWARFEGFAKPALNPVEVQVGERKLTITPDPKADSCVIK